MNKRSKKTYASGLYRVQLQLDEMLYLGTSLSRGKLIELLLTELARCNSYQFNDEPEKYQIESSLVCCKITRIKNKRCKIAKHWKLGCIPYGYNKHPKHACGEIIDNKEN